MNKIIASQFEYYYRYADQMIRLDNSCVIKDEKLMGLGNFFGFDNICGQDSFFEIRSPFLRETAVSTSSRCINRLRQLVVSMASLHGISLVANLETILSTFYTGKRILLLEDISFFASLFKHLCSRHGIELYTSEFYEGKKSGDIVNGTLNIDIQKTHFPENFFDLILHTEVFEHVPDAPLAEKEVVRILKKSGALIFTVPFEHDRETDNIYAQLSTDGITYLQEPIYHEDPVSPDGKCLVFRTFSLSDMEKRFKENGCTFYCEYFHSSYLGIIGNNAFTFTAKKDDR